MLVLDPWGGSGTTGIVASRQGIPSLCLDINPVMATFSAAKSYQILANAQEIEAFFGELVIPCGNDASDSETEPLCNIFSRPIALLLRKVMEAIPFVAHLGHANDGIDKSVSAACRDINQLVNPLYAFCLAVVFVSIRRLSGTFTMANPTWLRTAGRKVMIQPSHVLSELQVNSTNMLMDIAEFFGELHSAVPNYSLAGDSRSMPLREESVERVITSPPYLTRIDYAVSTMPEMSLFGGNELLSFVRHQTMGAPVITKNGKHQREEWGPLCNQLLDAIRTHRTKAAASYYWKNIVQYFMDTDSALSEIVRVLKPGGKGLIVVQSSYFKDIEMPLGDIYEEMATMKGLQAKVVYREEVKGHMAHVNTKSSIYKQGKVYHEDFVYFEKPHNVG
jgi:hypothetical protein